MRRCVLLLVLGLWLGSAGLAEENAVAKGPYDRLLEVYYSPLEDPHQGRVYEAAGQLLNAARELPKAIELPAGPPTAEPVQPAAPPTEVVVAPVRHTPRPKGWEPALDHPAVDREELAQAYFRARWFDEAAELYRAMLAEKPDDKHLLLMLLLCERNTGHADEALTLLQEVEEQDEAAGEWTGWMKTMMDLGASAPGGTE